MRLPPDRAEGPPQIAEAGAGGGHQGQARCRALAGEQEQGQGENGEPQGRRHHRRADMLGRRFVQAKGRRRRVDENHQDQGQRAEPAEKANAPAPTGHPAQPVGRDQVGQHGVVKHTGEFESGGGDDHQAQGQGDIAAFGGDEPQPGAGQHGDDRETADPWLAAAGAVGDGDGPATATSRPAAAVAWPRSFGFLRPPPWQNRRRTRRW